MNDNFILQSRNIWHHLGGVDGRLKYPYNIFPFDDRNTKNITTKEGYESYQWNPPEGYTRYTEPDPAASPKPTWDEMVEYSRLGALESTLRQAKYIPGKEEIEFARQQLAGDPLFVESDEVRFIGEGITHMASLMQIVESANQAGTNIPRVVLRDNDNLKVDTHSRVGVRAALDAMAMRENIVESAHNEVMSTHYWNFVKQVGDDSLTLDEREAASAALDNFAFRYPGLLEDAVVAYDTDALPNDIETLKHVYIERLEAAATGRQKELKTALTQQAIDNWSTCVDMDRALQEVAKQCALASIEVERVVPGERDIWHKAQGVWIGGQAKQTMYEHEGDDPPATNFGHNGQYYLQHKDRWNARNAYQNGVQNINAVTAANSPVWTINDVQFTSNQPNAIHVGGTRTIKIHADQPVPRAGDPHVPGRVSQSIPQARYLDNSPAPVRQSYRVDGTAAEYTLTIPAAETKIVMITCQARNLCGPARVVVKWTPPTP